MNRARLSPFDNISAVLASDWQGWGFPMRGIIQANIDRFTELLRTETDETKRAMLTRLLREEEVKLAELPKPEKKQG